LDEEFSGNRWIGSTGLAQSNDDGFAKLKTQKVRNFDTIQVKKLKKGPLSFDFTSLLWLGCRP
jgi:hypothetical protein